MGAGMERTALSKPDGLSCLFSPEATCSLGVCPRPQSKACNVCMLTHPCEVRFLFSIHLEVG